MENLKETVTNDSSLACAIALIRDLGQDVLRARDAFEATGAEDPAGLVTALEASAAERLRASPPGWRLDLSGAAAVIRREPGAAIALGAFDDKGDVMAAAIFAPAYPDADGDLICWASGVPISRNGLPVAARAWSSHLAALDIQAVPLDALDDPHATARAVHPARFFACASPCYSLALLALGEVDTARAEAADPIGVTLGSALVKAVGGVVSVEATTTPSGGPSDGRVDFTAGHPEIVRKLPAKFAVAISPVTSTHSEYPRIRRGRPGAAIASATLARAHGALLGQVAGDALGQLVEFRSASDIRRQYPDGVRDLVDGGTWDTLAGQPTDDSEMALMLARSIVAREGFDPEHVRRAYVTWLRSPPFDIGGTTRQGLTGSPNMSSQANGSLMRVSPLAVHLWRKSPDEVAAIVAQDSALTHPNQTCLDAVAVFSVAIGWALREHLGPREIYERARAWVASRAGISPGVAAIFEGDEVTPVTEFSSQMGWVLIALRNAFHQLLHAPSFEAGLIATASAGGDTDTNAAIAGALLGAVHGRDAIPLRWRRLVLSCRALRGRRIRPEPFWPDDLLELTEHLVSLG